VRVARQIAGDEVAHAAGTIAYELFCAVAPRVPFAPIGD
jgi:alanine racemase